MAGLGELRAEAIFGKTIDEQTQHHDEAHGHNPLRFLRHPTEGARNRGSLRKRKPRSTLPCCLYVLMSSLSERWLASRMVVPTINQARRRSTSVMRSCLSESVDWHSQHCVGTASFAGRPLLSEWSWEKCLTYTKIALFQGSASISFTGKTLGETSARAVSLNPAAHVPPVVARECELAVNSPCCSRSLIVLPVWQLNLAAVPAEFGIRRLLPLRLQLLRQFLSRRDRGFWHAADPPQLGRIQPFQVGLAVTPRSST